MRFAKGSVGLTRRLGPPPSFSLINSPTQASSGISILNVSHWAHLRKGSVSLGKRDRVILALHNLALVIDITRRRTQQYILRICPARHTSYGHLTRNPIYIAQGEPRNYHYSVQYTCASQTGAEMLHGMWASGRIASPSNRGLLLTSNHTAIAWRHQGGLDPWSTVRWAPCTGCRECRAMSSHRVSYSRATLVVLQHPIGMQPCNPRNIGHG